jgi:hypothetical protein
MTKKANDQEDRDRERSGEARWRVAEEGAQAEEDHPASESECADASLAARVRKLRRLRRLPESDGR